MQRSIRVAHAGTPNWMTNGSFLINASDESDHVRFLGKPCIPCKNKCTLW